MPAKSHHWQDLWADPSGDGEILGSAAARPALEATWRRFLTGHTLAPGDLILDVGSGAAPIARLARAIPGSKPGIVSVDYAPAALEAARRALGPGALGVAADARALPFAAASFAAVVSQFGLEYAGIDAFAEAARVLRAGGAFEAVIHAAESGIAVECHESARLVGGVLSLGLVRRLADTLEASYAAPLRPGSRGYLNKRKEAQFTAALETMRASLAAQQSNPAAALLRRYVADMERLAVRRFAFAPADALGWLAQIEHKLTAYRARMEAMLAAAQSAAAMAAISERLAGAGLADIDYEPLRFDPEGPIAAWRLSARRPETGQAFVRSPGVSALARSRARDLVAAGNAAYEAGRIAEAAELGRKAAAADPDNPSAHNLVGAACAEEMEHEASARAFEAAVAADPTVAISRVNLAYALILAGQFAPAEEHLRTALELEPEMAGAFLNLSWIHKAAPGDALIARLEDLRRRPGADEASRALYAFALGKFYDDVGAFDEAFACFKEGNDLHGVVFDASAWRAHVARLREVFNAAYFAERTGLGFRGEKPVFIVGMPRCGSSLLENRLARHPRVAALGERPDIGRLVRNADKNHPYAPYPEWAARLSGADLASMGRAYVEEFAERHPAALRLIDKNLLNHRFIGLIRPILPDATIIHCRRDPLDTCLSCYFQRFRVDHDYKFSLQGLGAYYRAYASLMTHWAEAAGGIIDADYEAFVENPDTEYERILKAVRLDPAPLTPEPPVRHIQTASAFQARQPVSRSSIGRWRRYKKHLGPLIEALGPLARI